jgi:hypothetical protein
MSQEFPIVIHANITVIVSNRLNLTHFCRSLRSPRYQQVPSNCPKLNKRTSADWVESAVCVGAPSCAGLQIHTTIGTPPCSVR